MISPSGFPGNITNTCILTMSLTQGFPDDDINIGFPDGVINKGIP